MNVDATNGLALGKPCQVSTHVQEILWAPPSLPSSGSKFGAASGEKKLVSAPQISLIRARHQREKGLCKFDAKWSICLKMTYHD